MGAQAPISQRCGFVKKAPQIMTLKNGACGKPRTASAQFGVKKKSEGPLSWASRPYRPFSSQKISLGYQLLPSVKGENGTKQSPSAFQLQLLCL